MTWAKRFGQAIREARESRKLTVLKAAKAIKIRPSVLGDLERGAKKPSFEIIFRIARTYKVEARDLFLWAETQTAPELRRMIKSLLGRCSMRELRKIHRIVMILRLSEMEEAHE
jgi:transcriptional regulator with XRE-family HTH domain